MRLTSSHLIWPVYLRRRSRFSAAGTRYLQRRGVAGAQGPKTKKAKKKKREQRAKRRGRKKAERPGPPPSADPSRYLLCFPQLHRNNPHSATLGDSGPPSYLSRGHSSRRATGQSLYTNFCWRRGLGGVAAGTHPHCVHTHTHTLPDLVSSQLGTRILPLALYCPLGLVRLGRSAVWQIISQSCKWPCPCCIVPCQFIDFFSLRSFSFSRQTCPEIFQAAALSRPRQTAHCCPPLQVPPSVSAPFLIRVVVPLFPQASPEISVRRMLQSHSFFSCSGYGLHPSFKQITGTSVYLSFMTSPGHHPPPMPASHATKSS